MKRWLWLLAALCLVLTGCQEEGAEGERLRDYVESGTPVGQIGEESPWLPEEFTLAYCEGNSLNPMHCGEEAAQDVAPLLYDTLFQLDESFSPEPWLCESYHWEGQSFVIQLRRDVVFSDGSAMTAADVVCSLQQAADSQRYGYRFRTVTAITAADNWQVALTLSQKNEGFAALLNIPILKKGTENQAVPVGSGAYVLTTQGDDTLLVRNIHDWREETLPVDTIHLVQAKDKSTALYLLSARSITLLTVDPTEDTLSRAGTVMTTKKDTSVMQFVGFSCRSGPCTQAAVRSAISDSIQRQWLVNHLLSGYGQAAEYPISPCSAAYPREDDTALAASEAKEALRLVLEQTCFSPRTLVFVVNADNSFHVSCATWLAEQLSTENFPITVQALPWESYLQAVSAGNFDLYYGEVKLTADWDIRSLVGTGGALNYGGFSDSAMDALLGGDFQALYDYFDVCQPIAPVCFLQQAVLTIPRVVEGLTPTQDNTFFRWNAVTVHLAEE